MTIGGFGPPIITETNNGPNFTISTISLLQRDPFGYDFGYYDFQAHDALGDCQATLHVFNCIVSDDSFGNPLSSKQEETVVSKHKNSGVTLIKEYSEKKSSSKRKLFLLGLVFLTIGVVGVILSSRIISGGFGLSYVFSSANFSSYLFDGFGIFGLIGLVIIILVIRSALTC